jgi:signal transduction histidine kinase
VVKNLVVNALEAMGEQGELTIVTGDIRGLPEEPVRDFGGGAQFWSRYRAYVLVRDTGPGMSEAFVRDRLFRPFVTTKDKGVGIGLYQCKTLTERMGGKLLCRSVEGEGTRFCVVLG